MSETKGEFFDDDFSSTPTNTSSSNNLERKRSNRNDRVDLTLEPSPEEIEKQMMAGRFVPFFSCQNLCLGLCLQSCFLFSLVCRDFVKHAFNRPRWAPRHVFFTKKNNSGFLHWCQPDAGQTVDEKRTIPIDEITDIYYGKQTNAFLRRQELQVDDALCFSIKAGRRMLDLEADSQRQRDSFIRAFSILLNSYDVCYRLHPSPNDKSEPERKGHPVKFQLLARTRTLPKTSMASLSTVLAVYEFNPSTGRMTYMAHTEKSKYVSCFVV
jgi:hypothetical protein